MYINGVEYKHRIEPTPYRRIRAEIFKLHRSDEILVTYKIFGKFYRGIIDQDYDDAALWVMSHFKSIEKAEKMLQAFLDSKV